MVFQSHFGHPRVETAMGSFFGDFDMMIPGNAAAALAAWRKRRRGILAIVMGKLYTRAGCHRNDARPGALLPIGGEDIEFVALLRIPVGRKDQLLAVGR